MVDMGDTLRWQGHQHLFVDVNYALMAHKFPCVIETIKVKDINCQCLLVHDVNKASNTVVDQLCVFMYTIGISEDFFFQVFIITQVVASLMMPVNFCFASARVGHEDKGILAYALVLGQQHKCMQGKRIGRMGLLAIWEQKVVTST